MKQKPNSKQEWLVSIIMPSYNSKNFIGAAIESVIRQSYQNWELIIVDDCSTDGSIDVINEYKKNDGRIKYYFLEKNSGAAVARNKAIEKATGKYIAFLDSDDLWFPEKLMKQIYFMKSKDCVFSCTKYDKIDELGDDLNIVIKVRDTSDYENVLRMSPGNSTVIYDAEVLGKFYIPDIKKRNDYVMWLGVIKKAKTLYGMQEILSSHRIREGAISSNKTKLIYYHWVVYREFEKLSVVKSMYMVVYWIISTVFKFRQEKC